MMKSLRSRSLAVVVAVIGMLFVAAGPATASPLVYHSGPVVRNPQVHVIFWGSNWNQNSGAREQIQGLFGSLSGSKYQGILTQYYDTGGNISVNVSADSWTDQSIAAPNNVSWTNIENEIQYGMKQLGWAGGINNLYMVLPAPGSKYQAGFQLAAIPITSPLRWAPQWCTWDGQETRRSANVPHMTPENRIERGLPPQSLLRTSTPRRPPTR
jgi:hypothetical protein